MGRHSARGGFARLLWAIKVALGLLLIVIGFLYGMGVIR